MAETIDGGCYLAADGVTYIDANGKPLDASKAAQANKVKQPFAPVLSPLVANPSLAPALPEGAVSGTVETVQPFVAGETAGLVAETERRAKGKQG